MVFGYTASSVSKAVYSLARARTHRYGALEFSDYLSLCIAIQGVGFAFLAMYIYSNRIRVLAKSPRWPD